MSIEQEYRELRANNEIPQYSTEQLLKLAKLEFDTLYNQIDGNEQKLSSLHINGYALVDIIENALKIADSDLQSTAS